MTTLKEAVAAEARGKAATAKMVDVQGLPAEAAVHRLINHAVVMKASDLCLLAHEDFLQISVRHLGILRQIGLVSPDRGRQFTQHIKAQSGLDVAEHRQPQDGRWLYEPDEESDEAEPSTDDPAGGMAENAPSGVIHLDTDSKHEDAAVDLRISTIPTLYGEDMVIRLLSRKAGLFELDELGFLPEELKAYRRMIESPSGLILCTGPTASGKTATLYATLRHLNDGKRKINTIEDPIEFAVQGLRQSQINPSIRLNFPDLLRSVLRQAPDVIMIGEIRDEETAHTAVRAANSGHLVLATLHAPVASAAVQAMRSLGVPDHFLASALRGVVTQRLIRTLDPKHRVKAETDGLDKYFTPVRDLIGGEMPEVTYRADPDAGPDAYSGRTAVFEVLEVSKPIRRLIAEGASTDKVRDAAIERGMIEFRANAMVEVARGRTSLDEVFRVIPEEYLDLERPIKT